MQEVDIRQSVVETMNKSKIHIVERALGGLVKHVIEKRLLIASTTAETADLYLITVPTPFKKNHDKYNKNIFTK